MIRLLMADLEADLRGEAVLSGAVLLLNLRAIEDNLETSFAEEDAIAAQGRRESTSAVGKWKRVLRSYNPFLRPTISPADRPANNPIHPNPLSENVIDGPLAAMAHEIFGPLSRPNLILLVFFSLS